MREIKLYNSLNDSLEVFKPISENKMSMYVCGPTVYGPVHIGNMRPVVVFDVLKRFFTYVGYEVTHISNITDVDDKIILAALRENISEKELTKKYCDIYFDNLRELNILEANHVPYVTENMDNIIEYIKELINKGYAYEVNGDVYFRVNKVNKYGELSNLDVDEIKVGARIEENQDKENPLDFTLWKKTDVGVKWDSPWSKGRPGWHTECVVMINKVFSDGRIDIHGGGFDLKFPHHENEIAQSLAMHGHQIASYWMHNGFVNIDNQKMSKSLGNVRLASDFLKLYGGSVVRLALLSTHYRAPINFTDEVMANNQVEYSRIENAIRLAKVKLQLAKIDYDSVNIVEDKMNEFIDELADDLNSSNAITIIFGLVKELNNEIRRNKLDTSSSIVKTLDIMLNILGFRKIDITLTSEDKDLFDKYQEAKNEKNFAKSDEIRKILMERKLM